MEACTFSDIEVAYDQMVAIAAPAQGIDPICSTSHWIVPVASAFAARSTPRVFTGPAGHVVLLEHQTPNGPVFSGFDAVWGFATPLIGPDPEALVTGFAALLPSLSYHALTIPGIDPAGPLFAAVQRLHPAGYTDTADRCVADIGGSADGFDAWLGRRSGRFRRSLRAAAHRAAAAGVTIERMAPTTAVDAAAAFERVLAIEKHSWKTDVESGLIGTNLGWFTKAMSLRFAAIGGLRVQFAMLDGQDVGYVIGARLGTRYRGFQHSFDQRFRELSIGKVSQYHAIEALAVEGVRTYDMGMHMTYKQSYADRIESTITLVVPRPTR